jgi:NAD-dependent SIR2 family protein deacetylase
MERLAEVHGRLGLYKWFAHKYVFIVTLSSITPNCKYSWAESITEEDVDLNALAVEGTSMEEGNLQLKKPPTCPACKQPVLPQSLLFDELYESHSHYGWDRCQLWMEEAEIFVFVGTSFSVGVTAEAIAIAEKEKKKVFNFNLTEDVFNCEMYNILGNEVVEF